MAKEFLALKNIHKYFSGVHALNDISLTLEQGEIHCLAGENGSGKSTLIKVISGVHAPDSGEIWVNGEKQAGLTPMKAIDQGIQVIYQDFSLFGNLTVAENLAINTNLRQKKRWVNWTQVRELAREALDRLRVDIDLNAEVSTLPVAQKQLIAIARALMFNVRLIIMDEPTTALTSKEVQVLFDVVEQIREKGISLLFVSHKMREMLEISHRVTVIRNGKKVMEAPTADLDEQQLTFHMTGQDIQTQPYDVEADTGQTPLLALDRWQTALLRDIDLNLYKREVVGVTGLLGSGRTALGLSLFGLEPSISGTLAVNGRPVDLSSVQDAIGAGIAYVPEDRLSEGLFLTQSINRNIQAATHDRFTRGMTLDMQQANSAALDMIRSLSIATPSGDNPVTTLSGGNQQRVVIAKWLLTRPRILVLNGPTVGVDVGSKAEIHAKIRSLAETEDLGILMISDDIPELIQNCNRILIMHKGAFVREIPARDADENQINAFLKSLV